MIKMYTEDILFGYGVLCFVLGFLSVFIGLDSQTPFYIIIGVSSYLIGVWAFSEIDKVD